MYKFLSYKKISLFLLMFSLFFFLSNRHPVYAASLLSKNCSPAICNQASGNVVTFSTSVPSMNFIGETLGCRNASMSWPGGSATAGTSTWDPGNCTFSYTFYSLSGPYDVSATVEACYLADFPGTPRCDDSSPNPATGYITVNAASSPPTNTPQPGATNTPAPGCTPDSSCAANTCTGSSCTDSCGNTYSGTKICSSPPTPTPTLRVIPTGGRPLTVNRYPEPVVAGTNLTFDVVNTTDWPFSALTNVWIWYDGNPFNGNTGFADKWCNVGSVNNADPSSTDLHIVCPVPSSAPLGGYSWKMTTFAQFGGVNTSGEANGTGTITNIPTPTPTPAIPAPTAQFTASCFPTSGENGSDISISWTNSGVQYVDFGTNSSVNPSAEKTVPSGTFSTDGIGFSGPFTWQPSTSYYFKTRGTGDSQVSAAMTTPGLCVNPNIDNLKFSINRAHDPWWQSIGMDVLETNSNGFWKVDPVSSNADLCSGVPNDYPLLNAPGENPGILFGNLAAYSPQPGVQTSISNWHVDTSSYSPALPAATTSYIAINNQLVSSNTTIQDITASNCSSGSCTLPTTPGVYKMNGTVTHLNNALNVNSGSYIFLINGTLNIDQEIHAASPAIVLFTASGDISIDSSVGTTSSSSCNNPTPDQIEAVISSDRNITINSALGGNCGNGRDKILNMQGSLITNASGLGGSLSINRSLCQANFTSPAFTIRERPDFLMHFPHSLQKSTSLYTEQNP